MIHMGVMLSISVEKLRNLFVVPKRNAAFSELKKDTPVRTRDGLRFILRPNDYIAREIYVFGLYERPFLKFLENHLCNSRTMLDVGANIGNHSVYLSRTFERVVSFEPNPTALEYLHQHKEMNDCANLTICEVGLGKENASLPFLQDPGDNLGMSHFLQETDDPSGATSCLSIRIGDQMVEELDIRDVDYVKIDVEGFELDVLTGLRTTIERHRPVVTFEFHGQNHGLAAFDEIASFLPGYRFFEPIYWLDDSYGFFDKLKYRLRYGTAPIMKEIVSPEERTYENIVALADQDQLQGVKFE